MCHGAGGAQQRTSFPNLTVTPLLHSQEGFDQVVLQGIRVSQGMPGFSEQLQPADSTAMRAYLVSRANELKNQPPAAAPVRAPTPPPSPPPARQPGAQDAHEEAATPR